MTTEVRTVRDEELGDFLDTVSTGFLDRPDIARLSEEVRPLWDLSRAWAAWDGRRAVGTFRSFGTEITLPGGAPVPATAVAGVVVLPTHRRRGVLRAMAAKEHAAARERGEAVALLHASEYGIYGRFGYGPATRAAAWTLDTKGTTIPGASGGTVELVRPDAAAAATVRRVFDTWRGRQPGEIARREFRWEFDLGLRESTWGPRWKGFLALHWGGAGEVDGYARYRAEEKWEHGQPRGLVTLDELHALDDRAYRDLWRFLAEIDLVATVKAENRTPAERLPWLLSNARAAAVSDVGDSLWARLLDVPRALEARTYERDGSLVLEVVDAEAAGGRSRFALEVDGGRATCRRVTGSPDLTVDVAALGAAWLGGTRLRDAVLLAGVDEHRPGALADADRQFATLDEPWCSTFF